MALHLVFNGPSNALKVYDNRTHALLFQCEARNATVGTETNGPAYFGHYGACPPGEYILGEPMPLDPSEVPYGNFYIPIVDSHGLWARYNRDGIGIHGGGSGLTYPFKDSQGWVITEGCLRLQNRDLAKIAGLVHSGDTFTVFQGSAS